MKRFAIKDIGFRYGYGDVLTLRATPDKIYIIRSFRPIIEKVAPKTRKDFSTIDKLWYVRTFFLALGLGSILLAEALDTQLKVGFLGASILGQWGFALMADSHYEGIGDEYNRRLKSRIYGHTHKPAPKFVTSFNYRLGP